MAIDDNIWRRLWRTLFPPGIWQGCVAIMVAAPVMGFGLLMAIQTPWGVGPWDVLHIGLAQQLGTTVGRANQLVGALVILLILLLRGRTLTIVTVLNVISVGWWLDNFAAWGAAPYVDGWPGLLYLAAGIVIMGFGVALYLHPDQGAGPRDGFMVTVHVRTGQPLYRIKIAMDLTALVGGWLLGGPVGIGTVMVAFGLGPVIDGFRRLFKRLQAGRPDAARQVSQPLPDATSGSDARADT